MEKVLIASMAAAGFYRLGRFWPKEGVAVDADAFTQDEWDVLSNEPMLSVRLVAAATPPDLDAVRDKIRQAIAGLAPEDFQKDGKPKVTALQKALPDVRDLITAALRDEVWATALPKAD